MNKQAKKVIITASILPKADEKMRLCAVREKLSLGELLEKYQEAYDEKQERDKHERKIQQELAKSGSVICPKCGQSTTKLLAASTASNK